MIDGDFGVDAGLGPCGLGNLGEGIVAQPRDEVHLTAGHGGGDGLVRPLAPRSEDK